MVVKWSPNQAVSSKREKLLSVSLVSQRVKNSPAKQEIQVLSLGWKDALEKGLAANSSTLTWSTP